MVRMNIVDRLVSWFNPKAGAQRMQARATMAFAGGYKGGRQGRRAMSGWYPSDGSVNTEAIPQLPVLRQRSRDLRRNVPTATGAIATNVTHVIGEGLKVRPAVDRRRLGLDREAAQEWNRLARAEFDLAARSADFTRTQTFYEMQALAFGSVLESGDILALRRFRLDPGDTYGAKLQLVEADRCCNPLFTADTETLTAGVETNRNGVVQAYHIANGHPGDWTRRAALQWRRVPARYNNGAPIVLHLFRRDRPDQARGIPYLAPVIEAIKSLGDYTDAEVRAAVVTAFFTVFVKGALEDGEEDDERGKVIPNSRVGADGQMESDLGHGNIIDLREGEEIQIADPTRPNPDFNGFVSAYMQQIGVALELPYELLIKHFSASYSASRAALEMAWQTFRSRRTWFARKMCQPYYEMVVEEAILRGRLIAPGFFDDPAIRAAWLTADWIGPVKMSLDPKKDAEADKLDIANGTKTREQIVTERTGGNVEAKIEQLGHEKRLMKDEDLEAAASPSSTPPASTPDEQEDNDDES